MAKGLICTGIINNRIYYCTNMIDVLNNQAFNKYKHIELKEPADYISISKVDSIKDFITYLRGCYSLCPLCSDGYLTPWTSPIKVKQI